MPENFTGQLDALNNGDQGQTGMGLSGVRPSNFAGSNINSTLHYKSSIVNDPNLSLSEFNGALQSLPTVSQLDKNGKQQIGNTGKTYRDIAPEGASF